MIFSTLTNVTLVGIVNPNTSVNNESFPHIAGEFNLLEYEITVDKTNTLWIKYNGFFEVMLKNVQPFYLCVLCNGDRFNVPIPANHKVVLEELKPEALEKVSRSFTHVIRICSID